KFALRLPQMEYTRFPWAANEPPRADTLRGLIEACGTAITRPTENICSHRSLAYSICLHRLSSTFALLFCFISVNFINVLAYYNPNYKIYHLSLFEALHR